MSSYFFTSESVCIGHPDKVCDQISDAILDACLEQDPFSRVACEVMVSTGMVIIAGEITTKAQVDYQNVARETVKEIGYNRCDLGFESKSCGILMLLNKQSPDIAAGVDATETKALGAGDQGIMFGYACDETPELMPLPIILSHQLVQGLYRYRRDKKLPYLRPDGKSQVTVEYDEKDNAKRIHTVVLSAQHDPDISQKKIEEDLRALILNLLPLDLVDSRTQFYINSTGRFVNGGPAADCGLTGRKIIVDTYGGRGHHGGGAFSGKDPSKVDRSAAYAARYVAKNIVAAGLAKSCEVQISYGIGLNFPLSIKVDTFGTGKLPTDRMNEMVSAVFDLSPQGIIDMLDLRRPIYKKTAFGGHFGRADASFTWEKCDKVDAILEYLKTD